MPITLQIEARQNTRRLTEPLELEENEITVRELIETRVRQQLRDRAGPEVGKAVAAALAAFERGAYLVVLDDRRLERLDERIALTPISRLTFWRLIPLVGG